MKRKGETCQPTALYDMISKDKTKEEQICYRQSNL